jgi:hypothetical protein
MELVGPGREFNPILAAILSAESLVRSAHFNRCGGP